MPDLVTGPPVLTPVPHGAVPKEPVSSIVPDVRKVPETPKAADLVKRTSAESVATPLVTPEPFPKPNLDDIKDPTARQFVEKRIAELERGYNDKFMSLAEQRKQTETLRTQLETQTKQPWTTERVQSLLRDPAFVQAAQATVEGQVRSAPPSIYEGSATQWSALTPEEKTAWRNMEARQRTSEQQMAVVLTQQQQMMDTQEHERIKTRFPDYDLSRVETLQRSIVNGEIPTEHIKEMIWKADQFDRYVENSYQFGLRDRQGTLQEKLSGSTTHTATQVNASEADKPTLHEGERPRLFFQRLAEWNMRHR